MGRLLIAISLLVLLFPTNIMAGGFSNPDMGGRRMGMFSVMGKPDDVSSIFHNPAGLVLLDGTQIYHAQSFFFIDMGMKLYDSEGVLHPLDHEITPDWSMGWLPFLGVASDFNTKRFRAGLALYAPNAYGASLPRNEPTRYHATRALFVAARTSLSAAFRFTEHFSVGLTADLMYVHLHAQRVMNSLVLADPDKRFADPEVLAPFDAPLTITGRGFTWAWNIGLLFEPTDSLGLGFKFGSGSNVKLRGPVELKNPDGTTNKTTQRTSMVIPCVLRAGFNWEFAPQFEWAADVFYWHYQVLQEQRTVLNEPLMGLNGFVDPKNYGNSWAWNTGLLYHAHPDVELMLGFQMDFTPIPTKTYSLDNPTRDQLGVSAGVRWQATDHWRFSQIGRAHV